MVQLQLQEVTSVATGNSQRIAQLSSTRNPHTGTQGVNARLPPQDVRPKVPQNGGSPRMQQTQMKEVAPAKHNARNDHGNHGAADGSAHPRVDGNGFETP